MVLSPDPFWGFSDTHVLPEADLGEAELRPAGRHRALRARLVLSPAAAVLVPLLGDLLVPSRSCPGLQVTLSHLGLFPTVFSFDFQPPGCCEL